MELFGVTIPLWAIFLGIIIIVIIAWKLIKFALKIFIIVIAAGLILIGLDLLHVFDWLQNLMSNLF
jgi:hypothetical protein